MALGAIIFTKSSKNHEIMMIFVPKRFPGRASEPIWPPDLASAGSSEHKYFFGFAELEVMSGL